MTKAEYIERYGLERYERRKTQNAAWNRKRYQNDPEFRESEKVRTHTNQKERWSNNLEYRESMNTRNKARNKARYHNDPEYRKRLNRQNSARIQVSYVEDDRIDLIENYELAAKDNFEGWHIHHRMEIYDDYINSKKHLKMMNLYYNRPPAELIWLRHSEHTRIHGKARRRNKCKSY